MDKLHLNILGLYLKSKSKVNKYSNGDFIDEFLELMGEIILSYDNLIIMGDFNLHLNNLHGSYNEFFIDTIKALRLQQEVNFLTHNCGNNLDAVIHDLQDKLKLVTCNLWPFILDHCIVNCVVCQPRENVTRHIINYQKINDIDISQLSIGLR